MTVPLIMYRALGRVPVFLLLAMIGGQQPLSLVTEASPPFAMFLLQEIHHARGGTQEECAVMLIMRASVVP